MLPEVHEEPHPHETSSQVSLKEHPSIQRVIALGIDASGYSEYAFHWALENIVDPSSDLIVLLHVRQIPSIPGPFGKPCLDPGIQSKGAKGTAYMDFTEYLSQLEQNVSFYFLV